ncbi:MAG: AMP-binding protein, partial [Proteobacteria bacterium]|nr:AMP-binding protein [Pseudomonadota bacterium]
LDVTQGDRVLVQVDKSPHALLLYLATLRIGAIFVPLNTAYTPTEVAYFLGDARPRLFVARPETEDDLCQIAHDAGATLLTFDTEGEGSLADAMTNAEPVEEIASTDANDIASIIYTSGTTGRSKGAMLSHDNLASNALTLIDLWGFRETDVLLHALPIYHVHGLFVAVHCAMLCGISMRFLERFDPDEVMRQLPAITVMMGVPTFYTRLLQTSDFNQGNCERVRLFISGSAPLLEQTWQAFFGQTGQRILERYGMSEAIMIASNPLEGERVPGTVGYALPNVTIRICDNQNQPVAAGETGVLQMQGPNVFKGYWQMPEKTAREFTDDGFFISGDMAKMDEHGRIQIVGREKDLVISGGLNIYPKEIEEAIDALDGVSETAIIGVPHADLGEGLVAVICPKAGFEIKPEAMITTLKSRLAGFKVPRKIFTVDRLPRNAMGKVQKNVLREQFANAFDP